MKVPLPQTQNPMVYPYWETWLGVTSVGINLTTLVPMIGNMPCQPHGVPVIRDFATVRFAARMSSATAGPPAAWNAILYKNGAAAAYALAIAWGVAPAVTQTSKVWTDITGATRLSPDFRRGDYWGIELAGVSLITTPSVICMFDMWGRFQTAGGPGS